MFWNQHQSMEFQFFQRFPNQRLQHNSNVLDMPPLNSYVSTMEHFKSMKMDLIPWFESHGLTLFQFQIRKHFRKIRTKCTQNC
jgi:hypothetical protein